MSDSRTILFLAGNPQSTSEAGLTHELRDIGEGLQRSQRRDSLKLEHQLAARPRDIRRAMLDIMPEIVHFSGRDAGTDGLVFEDEGGNAKPISGHALANLFALFADQITCVVLNGCYSEPQAQEISQYIDYVIGMQKAIGDRAAIEFSVGFYDALGAGRTIEFAYKMGCSAIELEGFPEHLVPVLLHKPTNAKALSLSKTASDTSFSTIIQGRQHLAIPDTQRQTEPTLPEDNKAVTQAAGEEKIPVLPHPKPSFHRRTQPLQGPLASALLTSISLTAVVLLVRLLGFLEPLELKVYDHLLRLRSQEVTSLESPITIIEATAEDHQVKREQNESGPGAISNEALNDVLQQLAKEEYKPTIIALDLYRDSPSDPLVEKFSHTSDLFAVCESPSEKNPTGVAPPIAKGIPPKYVGFSNLIPDIDGVLRRQLIELPPIPDHPCQSEKSLSFLVALRYIEKKTNQTFMEEDMWTPNGDLSLNSRLIERIDSYSFGGYQNSLESDGMQFLLNYQAPTENLREIAPYFRLEDIRQGKISGKYLKDRIVLIGITDRSEAVDFVQTPYGETAGVTIQAHMINQLISTALSNRTGIWVFAQWAEALWISSWSIVGTLMGLRVKSHKLWILFNSLGLIIIYGLCILTMNLKSGWIPFIPAIVGLTLSGTVVHYRYHGIAPVDWK